MKNKRNLASLLTAGLALATNTGCLQHNDYQGQTYAIRQNIERPETNDTIEGWRNLYNSIDEKFLTNEESEFVENFKKMPKEKQDSYLFYPELEELNLINQENPTLKDIIFIFYVDEYVGANKAALKGIGH